MTISIFWFRNDLRINDNPALLSAANNSKVLPIYISENDSKLGAASKWWLHQSLTKFSENLDYKLSVYQGQPGDILIKLCKKHSVYKVFWNRSYTPNQIENDEKIISLLSSNGITVNTFNGSLLWEPSSIASSSGNQYKVFTPYFRHCYHNMPVKIPLPKPTDLHLIKDDSGISINQLGLLSKINWHSKFEPLWKIGEEAAKNKLNRFIDKILPGYKENRNYPWHEGTSMLSPHLHFGEISPNQVWHSVINHLPNYPSDAEHFLSELGWREFSYYLLNNFHELANKNFQVKFDRFPWQYNNEHFNAWKKGQTGYPIIDAGMRQLWQTGYMHNRVRMIVASFLVKNLLIDWRYGAEWFLECLVDADLANNSASWQWVAGSGADASPYFRIFNPVLQGEKFDNAGIYTKKYVPELKDIPNKYLFNPWNAPISVLQSAGITLGTTYPNPLIPLDLSRKQALEAYKQL
jgi:deoxyribodipyrimidine photo-lyase